MTESKKKISNPLYVVRNNGVDVEQASGLIDLLLKKAGIDKIMPILENIFAILLSQVQSYAMFMEVKKIMDSITEKVVEVIFQAQQFTARKKA